ncbi:MAG: TolC family protein [Bacteroidales bacterium]|nr:TolC family protein [Bacteroidales bacterium]
MRKIYTTAVAVVMACVIGSRAQSTTSLDALLQRVETDNSAVRASAISIEMNEQQERVARSAWLPDVNASVQLSYLGDGTILDRDFSNATRDPLPHFSNTFTASLYQPVFTGGVITGGVDLAKSQTRLSRAGYRQTLADKRFQVAQCYLNLFKCHNLIGVYDQNIALTEQLLEQMNARRAQGVVLKNDITRYELRLSSLRYDRLTLTNSVATLSHDLRVLCGLEEQQEIEPDSTILATPLPCDGPAHWLALARGESPLLQINASQVDILEARDKIDRAERFPKVGVIAGDNLGGPVTFEIPAIDKNYNAWWVGVNISYNFSSLYKTNKKTRLNRIERMQLKASRESIDDDLSQRIHATYTMYIQSQEMIVTELKNVELATENYRVVENRFNNQLALLTDMLDASTARLDAETRLVNARINTLLYYYQLKYISGTL